MTRMSEAEARRAGLLPGKPAKKRTTRKSEPRNGAVSRCVKCDATFSGDAAETRHVEQEHHHRFESVDA